MLGNWFLRSFRGRAASYTEFQELYLEIQTLNSVDYGFKIKIEITAGK